MGFSPQVSVRGNSSLTLFPLFFILFTFSVFARGGWDIWSQTFIHLASLLLFFLWFFQLNRKSVLWVTTPLDFPLFLLLSASFFSYLFSVSPMNSLMELFNIINYIFVFYFSVALTREGKGELLIQLIIGTGSILALIGFLQFFQGTAVRASLINPNILAGYLVIVVPLAVHKFLKQGRWIYLFSTLITVWSLFLTGSLTGLFALFLALGVYFHFQFRRSRLLRTFLAIGLVLFIYLFSRKLSSPEGLNRLFWWRGAWRMIKDHFLWGVGPGNFGLVYPYYKIWGIKNSLYAHNHYLQLAAEGGILVLGGFVWFLGKLFIKGKQNSKAAFCSLLALVVHNLFDYNLIIPANALLFWSVAGYLTGKSWSGKKLRLPLSGENRAFLAVFLFSITLALTRIVVSPWLAQVKVLHGKEQMARGRIAEAMDNYEKALHLFPLMNEARASLGEAFFSLYRKRKDRGYLEEAIVRWEDVFKREPLFNPDPSRYTELHLVRRRLFQLYRLKGDMGKAKELLRRAKKARRGL